MQVCIWPNKSIWQHKLFKMKIDCMFYFVSSQLQVGYQLTMTWIYSWTLLGIEITLYAIQGFANFKASKLMFVFEIFTKGYLLQNPPYTNSKKICH